MEIASGYSVRFATRMGVIDKDRTPAPRPPVLLRPVLLAGFVLVLAGVVDGLIALIKAMA